jgi:sarcosine oxidase subunit gamma
MADAMTLKPTRRSPLTDRAAELASLPIGARELPFLTQLNLRLDAEAPAAVEVGKVLGGPLPTVPCTASRFGEVEVLWLGPNEWLVLAPAGSEQQLAAGLQEALADEHGAVTDVSAQRTAVQLSGTAARDVLTRGCSIDLHPKITPVGSCVQTLLAQTGVVIVVHDETASDFLVLVRASFADYLASWLIDACVEVT